MPVAVANCLFCKVVAGDMPASIVYEDDRCLAFTDINPRAPTHVLVIPREHIPTVGAATPEQEGLLGHLLLAAHEVARKAGIAEKGYRLAINCGADAGQAVPHLHVHVLGGRKMAWPPG